MQKVHLQILKFDVDLLFAVNGNKSDCFFQHPGGYSV